MLEIILVVIYLSRSLDWAQFLSDWAQFLSNSATGPRNAKVLAFICDMFIDFISFHITQYLNISYLNFVKFRSAKKGQQKNAESNDDKETFCRICNIPFTRASTKKRHDTTFHDAFFKEYSCNFCDLKSRNPRNIISHHLIKHKQIQVPSEEEICWEPKENSEKSE